MVGTRLCPPGVALPAFAAVASDSVHASGPSRQRSEGKSATGKSASGKRGAGNAGASASAGSAASETPNTIAGSTSNGTSGAKKKPMSGRGRKRLVPATGGPSNEPGKDASPDPATSAILPPLPPSVARLKSHPPASSHPNHSVHVPPFLATHSRELSTSSVRTEPGDDTEVEENGSGTETDGYRSPAFARSSPTAPGVALPPPPVSPSSIAMPVALVQHTLPHLQGQRVNLDEHVHPADSLLNQDYSIGLTVNLISPVHAPYVQQLVAQAVPDPEVGLSVVASVAADPFLHRHQQMPTPTWRTRSMSEATVCLLILPANDPPPHLVPAPLPYAAPQHVAAAQAAIAASNAQARGGRGGRGGTGARSRQGSVSQTDTAATVPVQFASLYPALESNEDTHGAVTLHINTTVTPVPAGRAVLEYMGHILPASQHPHMLSPFSLQVPGLPLIIDASRESNAARFCRRSCRGNLSPHTYVRRTPNAASPLAVALVANRDIESNEALTVAWSPSDLACLASPAQCKPNPNHYLLFECATCPLSAFPNCALYRALSNNPDLVVVPVLTKPIDSNPAPPRPHAAPAVGAWKHARQRSAPAAAVAAAVPGPPPPPPTVAASESDDLSADETRAAAAAAASLHAHEVRLRDAIALIENRVRARAARNHRSDNDDSGTDSVDSDTSSSDSAMVEPAASSAASTVDVDITSTPSPLPPPPSSPRRTRGRAGRRPLRGAMDLLASASDTSDDERPFRVVARPLKLVPRTVSRRPRHCPQLSARSRSSWGNAPGVASFARQRSRNGTWQPPPRPCPHHLHRARRVRPKSTTLRRRRARLSMRARSRRRYRCPPRLCPSSSSSQRD
ncbi:hypothetical protein AMAG_20251 [Allomyces macrogynus ATCC 38327]|uniref:SET domain-containing protein n=1 Tax=Allomyces macrogynus (strain ATCC 38327) TaxID=578462 RepID=A0A0L0T6K4_ALLM3|nr:hypothetical protein AMAG_20251 [Allomyces macrogynus ATCC 38327]|eukprot:KNE70184.1 hypothetical protein AMAG_20251 [Allomyces macrogynus ATCC 38327]